MNSYSGSPISTESEHFRLANIQRMFESGVNNAQEQKNG